MDTQLTSSQAALKSHVKTWFEPCSYAARAYTESRHDATFRRGIATPEFTPRHGAIVRLDVATRRDRLRGTSTTALSPEIARARRKHHGTVAHQHYISPALSLSCTWESAPCAVRLTEEKSAFRQPRRSHDNPSYLHTRCSSTPLAGGWWEPAREISHEERWERRSRMGDRQLSWMEGIKNQEPSWPVGEGAS